MVVIRKLIRKPLGDWGEEVVTRKRKHIVRNVALGALAAWAVGLSLYRLSEQNRQNDLAIAEFRGYQTQLDVYATQREQRTTCLNSVETRETYRERFLASAESKRRFAEIIDLGVDGDAQALVDDLFAVVDDEVNDIETDLPPRDPAECPPEPVPPVPPGETPTTAPTEEP